MCMVNHIEIVQEALLKKPLDFADRLPIYSCNIIMSYFCLSEKRTGYNVKILIL